MKEGKIEIRAKIVVGAPQSIHKDFLARKTVFSTPLLITWSTPWWTVGQEQCFPIPQVPRVPVLSTVPRWTAAAAELSYSTDNKNDSRTSTPFKNNPLIIGSLLEFISLEFNKRTMVRRVFWEFYLLVIAGGYHHHAAEHNTEENMLRGNLCHSLATLQWE